MQLFIPIGPTEMRGKTPPPTEAEFTEFFSLLGQTIASWQMVESRIYNIFCFVVGIHNDSLASAFYSIPAFRGRLGALDAAIATSKLNNAQKEEWKKLKDTASKRANKRNAIAHANVYHDYKRPEGRSLFLAPDPHNATKFDGFGQGVIGCKELIELTASFHDLSSQVSTFWFSLLDSGKVPENGG